MNKESLNSERLKPIGGYVDLTDCEAIDNLPKFQRLEDGDLFKTEKEITELDKIKDLLIENGFKFTDTEYLPPVSPEESQISVPAILIDFKESQKVIDLLNDAGMYFGSEKLWSLMAIY
jgi:hypothetical protein